jgi:hypothetical protein
MLNNPKELPAIIATQLTVFAIGGVSDVPIRATGALLLDLSGALKRMDTHKAQVSMDPSSESDVRGSDAAFSSARRSTSIAIRTSSSESRRSGDRASSVPVRVEASETTHMTVVQRPRWSTDSSNETSNGRLEIG